jgi:TldD protein
MSADLHSLFDCDETEVQSIVAKALTGADDGELFIERSESESLAFTDGKLKQANYSTGLGFGLRVVAGEAVGYAHADALKKDALLRAADAVGAVTKGHSGTMAAAPAGTNRHRCLPPK